MKDQFCCSDCAHWERNKGKVTEGRCKEGSPATHAFLVPGAVAGQLSVTVTTVWPVTAYDEGACGKFEPAGAETEAEFARSRGTLIGT